MPGRRNRAPLSREQVLTAALEIVDENGVDALSMRSVASRLGVEAMSLYHHVSNKQALLDGLIDLVVQTAELPTAPRDAEAWVRETAAGWRRLASEHPHRIALVTMRTLPLADPRSARPFEAGMAAFVEHGFDVRQAYLAVQTASLAMMSMTQMEAAAALKGYEPDDEDSSSLAQLPDADFPLLHAVNEQPPEVDEQWEAMIAALVRGLS